MYDSETTRIQVFAKYPWSTEDEWVAEVETVDQAQTLIKQRMDAIQLVSKPETLTTYSIKINVWRPKS